MSTKKEIDAMYISTMRLWARICASDARLVRLDTGIGTINHALKVKNKPAQITGPIPELTEEEAASHIGFILENLNNRVQKLKLDDVTDATLKWAFYCISTAINLENTITEEDPFVFIEAKPEDQRKTSTESYQTFAKFIKEVSIVYKKTYEDLRKKDPQFYTKLKYDPQYSAYAQYLKHKVAVDLDTDEKIFLNIKAMFTGGSQQN